MWSVPGTWDPGSLLLAVLGSLAARPSHWGVGGGQQSMWGPRAGLSADSEAEVP